MNPNKENIIFFYDSFPVNYIKVCLQSLRKHNPTCNIFFFYKNPLIKIFYRKFNINFIKIDRVKSKNKLLFYKVYSVKEIANKLNLNDFLLVCDLDILFQNNPFLMFDQFPGNDFYYTHCLMSGPESKREEKIWKNCVNKVNGGVWGINVNSITRELMAFWIRCEEEKYWKKWEEFSTRKEHLIDGKTDLNWFFDQDFLNCIDQNNVPLSKDLKKVNVGFEYNYFTSNWGFFNIDLNMGNKIGNPNFPIIHFKGIYKKIYNLHNSRIYNMRNISLKKDLTSQKSREMMYRKFMSRGEKRFELP
tara:strand:+ start:273 stop:1181 length:909 start_codon:yes stop_codon:yes gene_type:complete